MITNHEADILAHASSKGRYVTADADVLDMAASGLLNDYGPQPLADGDHYLTLSEKGRSALAEWRAAQTKPKKRRVSGAFESWEPYQDAFGHIPFSRFWKEIWPFR